MTGRGRRRRSSGLKWVVLGVVLFAGFYFSRGFFTRLTKPVHPPNAFYTVKRADMLISLKEEGALRALNETVVRSALEGYNRIIYLIPEGSYVQKDDLLVELDSSGLKDRLNEQELAYQERLFQMLQASGNLKIQKSLAESQIKDAELKVENAISDLEKYRDGDAPLLIKTVEARTGVLAEQVRIASERYARTEQLFKSNNATRSEVEADALTMKREQLALSQYQEDLRLIKKYDQPNQIRMLQSKVDQAKAELERLKQRTSNEIAQADADLRTSQSSLAVMEESIATQKKRLESTKITAPQNGLVVYASVSPFQMVNRSDMRREEGRFRERLREDGGGGMRGGGRRGGRSNSDGSSGGGGGQGGGNSSSGGSSTAETIASGNQRIASAVSGSSVNESSGGGSGNNTGGGTGQTTGGGGGGGGGGRSGGSSGGQNASSAAGAFASYPSLRPSSLFGASTVSSNASGGNGAGSSGSSSMLSTGSQNSSFSGGMNQSQFQQRRQTYDSWDGDYYGSPGLLEEGLMVRQRQELIRLPDVTKMLAEIKIDESRVRQVKNGMPAIIEVQNIPHQRFKGTVRRVALMPDAQSSWMNPNVKLYPADIMVDEELPILKPGVSARVEIIITNLTRVLSVPIQTVARLEGENVCYVQRGSRVTPVSVTTGLYNDTFVEITSGLKEGDKVLLAAVGDEDFEEAPPADTNVVERAPEEMRRPPTQGMDAPPGEGRERRLEGRNPNPESPTGDAPTERRRGRPGRRPQGSPDSPE